MLDNLHDAAIPVGPDAAWAAFLAQGRFMLQRCMACKAHIFFPRVLCPHCGATTLEWVQASGDATVYSATVVRRKPQHGGDYNVVLVDLAEGPRMMSRVEGIGPDAVCIGMRVRASIEDGAYVGGTAGDRTTEAAGEKFVVFRPMEVNA